MRKLKEYAALVNERLEELLPSVIENTYAEDEMPRLLRDAMRYSLLSGGKRLRPSMMLLTAEAFGKDPGTVLDQACAVEMIHTYSLIHDDLPGMDNDVLRRGRPTNHVVYGEGQAILAGDGLLNTAAEVLLGAALSSADPVSGLKAAGEIIRGAGCRGMIGGQCADLESERGSLKSEAVLSYIQVNKTARMFMHPLKAAAILCGAAEKEQEALSRFGRAFGLLFQATDDLLDLRGDPSILGKSVGKDEESGKLTCVGFYGEKGTEELCRSLLEQAELALDVLPSGFEEFRTLARGQLGREL